MQRITRDETTGKRSEHLPAHPEERSGRKTSVWHAPPPLLQLLPFNSLRPAAAVCSCTHGTLTSRQKRTLSCPLEPLCLRRHRNAQLYTPRRCHDLRATGAGLRLRHSARSWENVQTEHTGVPKSHRRPKSSILRNLSLKIRAPAYRGGKRSARRSPHSAARSAPRASAVLSPGDLTFWSVPAARRLRPSPGLLCTGTRGTQSPEPSPRRSVRPLRVNGRRPELASARCPVSATRRAAHPRPGAPAAAPGRGPTQSAPEGGRAGAAGAGGGAAGHAAGHAGTRRATPARPERVCAAAPGRRAGSAGRWTSKRKAVVLPERDRCLLLRQRDAFLKGHESCPFPAANFLNPVKINQRSRGRSLSL